MSCDWSADSLVRKRAEWRVTPLTQQAIFRETRPYRNLFSRFALMRTRLSAKPYFVSIGNFSDRSFVHIVPRATGRAGNILNRVVAVGEFVKQLPATADRADGTGRLA